MSDREESQRTAPFLYLTEEETEVQEDRFMVICKATVHGVGVQNKPLTSGAFSFLLRGTI